MNPGIHDGLILGGYALEPAPNAPTGGEREWYDLLAAVPGAGGVEVPFRAGALHPGGAAALARLLPAGWRVVITMLPATMAGLRAAPGYGLASRDADGRAAALADVRAALVQAARLRDATGEDTVLALHLTSAPRGSGDPAALRDSLEQLAPEAGGVLLSVEHCDPWRADGRHEKGFLPLGDETDAVIAARGATRGLPGALGQTLNWGRSAIDTRSAAGPAAQAAELALAGTLSGLMLSGAADTAGALGAAWADAHNPIDSADPASLLTSERIDDFLTAQTVGAASYVGVKVQDPADSADATSRIAPLVATATVVAERLEALRSAGVAA